MKKDITIVGGGITGLAAAYIATKHGHQVTVVEGGNEFGGLLNTFDLNGTNLEFYYHHFFTHDAEIQWLIRELDLTDKLVYHDSTMGVFRDGKTYPFDSTGDLLRFKPISFFDKIKFGLSTIYMGKFANWKKHEGTSALQWLRKKAGRTTTNALWEPLMRIKFGPFANVLPLSWMIGRIKQRFESRDSDGEKLGYLDGSLQVLLDALLQYLKDHGTKLITNAKLESLTIENNKLQAIHTSNGSFESDQFLFTIPSIYLYPLLENGAPTFSKELARVEYFGAVCTILELNRPLSDIYWLNVSDEGFPFGGIIEHTNMIPSKEYGGSHVAYLSRYFAMEEDIAKMSNDEIQSLMIPELKRIYPEFDQSWIKNTYVFRTNTAAVVCDLNFSTKVPDCKTDVEGMYLANMSHVYPDERSTNNSIRVAAEACKAMGVEGVDVPYGTALAGQIGFDKISN